MSAFIVFEKFFVLKSPKKPEIEKEAKFVFQTQKREQEGILRLVVCNLPDFIFAVSAVIDVSDKVSVGFSANISEIYSVASD